MPSLHLLNSSYSIEVLSFSPATSFPFSSCFFTWNTNKFVQSKCINIASQEYCLRRMLDKLQLLTLARTLRLNQVKAWNIFRHNHVISLVFCGLSSASLLPMIPTPSMMLSNSCRLFGGLSWWFFPCPMITKLLTEQLLMKPRADGRRDNNN